jgi:hypothetical protein
MCGRNSSSENLGLGGAPAIVSVTQSLASLISDSCLGTSPNQNDYHNSFFRALSSILVLSNKNLINSNSVNEKKGERGNAFSHFSP